MIIGFVLIIPFRELLFVIQDIVKQIRSLKSGTQIVIGTPGRVMDHMRRKTMKLDFVHTVVLDEADEMLNMGFREDIEFVLSGVPEERQTVLFSATMPKPILEITDRFQNDAKLVKVAAQELTIPLVSQKFYRVKNTEETPKQPGDRVKAGDILGYIEAMKTYNAIRAEFDGTITAILVNSGDAVEEDDVIMKIAKQ